MIPHLLHGVMVLVYRLIPHLLHGVMVLVYWLIPHLLHGVMVLVKADTSPPAWCHGSGGG